MKTTSISYQQTIPTGSYANERLGVEIELSEGDTPEEAFKYAKELVEKIHRDNNPQLYLSHQTAVANNTPTLIPEEPIKRTIPLSKEEKEKKNIEDMISKIEKYTDSEMLIKDHKHWMNNAAIKAAIDLRLLQLKQTV